MSRIVLFLLFCVGCCLVSGCGKSGGAGEGKAGQPGVHAAAAQGQTAEPPGREMVAVIQKQKLPDYPVTTVGEAFKAYRFFDKSEWKEKRTNDGKYYIDFVGWLKPGMLDGITGGNGNLVKGVEVKFVIYQDGQFYVAMVSKIQSGADGKLSAFPLADVKPIMDAIYGNKKMAF